MNSIHEVVTQGGPRHDRVLGEIARWWQDRQAQLVQHGDVRAAAAAKGHAEHYGELARLHAMPPKSGEA